MIFCHNDWEAGLNNPISETDAASFVISVGGRTGTATTAIYEA